MPAPRAGRRSALFDHAHPDWRWALVLRRARQGRRPAPVRGEGIQKRHARASLRGAEVGAAFFKTAEQHNTRVLLALSLTVLGKSAWKGCARLALDVACWQCPCVDAS